jgi:hypothetical protein
MDEDVKDAYFARLRTRLGEDFRLLRAAIAAADPQDVVPSRPEWTATRLARHVAQTYLHEAESIRSGASPEDWPPSDLNPDPVGLLDESFAALTAVFDERRPTDPAPTWHRPDQTVGFWIRRTCLETVVRRVDAEQAAGLELAPIPADIALDGVDEFLELFVGYLSEDRPERFADVLAQADPRPVIVSAGSRSWSVEAQPAGVSVRPALAVAGIGTVEPAGPPVAGPAGEGATLIEGEPDDLLLWLWRRAGDRSVHREGDAALLDQFLALRERATR